MLGADEVVLTLHSKAEADAPPCVFSSGSCLSPDARARIALLVSPEPSVMQGWALPHTAPEWTSSMLDGRVWHWLSVPVWSHAAQACMIVNFMYKTASFADKEHALDQLEQLRPIIDGYLRLWQAMRSESRECAGLRCALDSDQTGVVLLDRNSKITFANKAAIELLANGDPLRRTGNSLAASDLRQAVPLQVALSHAIAGNIDPDFIARGKRRAPVLALHSQHGQSLVLSVVPAEEPATEHNDVAAIMYMLDARRDATKQIQPVCAIFGLSPVETRLVCLLVAGKTLQEVAEAMRIKGQTARSYLKQVFLKTETKRQADLVRVMLSSLLPIERTIEPVPL